ncbi:3-oxoacyl-ACP synthase III family protein [Streptomyces sp. NBC_01296]|uniref:3-oxoacyl-ACP synthase III family protein n=1 Tax=Streptomyces sp. NBC_01296 TaxID=2903816 RepID=UPI002E1608C7|nr:beta-ketoacyl-ACP synthase 3 [Streptomyces sp. NBC_01296]
MSVHSPVLGPIGILGTGSYLPERIVPNETIAARTGVTPAWIERKTGIRERRYAAPHEAASDLAAEAAVRALENSGTAPEDLAWIVVATSTPDHSQPATAALVQHRLGAYRAAAFDVNAVCSGFAVALHTGARLLAAPEADGRRRRALIIGADVYSRIIDPADRRTAPLFGDGAGAVVLGPVQEGYGLLGTGLRTDGRLHDLIGVTAGGSRMPATPKTVARGDHWFTMRGRDVREFVVRELPGAIAQTLTAFDVHPDEIAHFVPHQANGEMLRSLAGSLGLTRAVLHLPVERHGNTGAASIPLALDHAVRADGGPAEGDLVLLAGFGGGMTVGTALMRWGGVSG